MYCDKILFGKRDDEVKNRIINFIKKETVLLVSAILAIVSMVFVPPSAKYISYIDLPTISLLFCLMAVMAGLRKIGLFSSLANSLLARIKNFRSVSLALILLCFFTSMFITNDVALITFVPFAIEVVRKSEKNEFMIPIVVLQTIAANLGSMLTPVGNPQNLYLYSLSGMYVAEFILLVLPYTAIAFVMLVIANFSVKSEFVEYKTEKINFSVKSTVFYIALFLVCMLTVANILEYWVTFIIVTAAIVLTNKKMLLKVDYSLLMTFIFFFVFIGNMSNVDAFKNAVSYLLNGREILISIVLSQVISNVPAAVLLSGFTDNIRSLIIGTNIGGLGTLIASMASLISYKIFVSEMPNERKKYFWQFTLWNIIFLIVLSIFIIVI